MKKKSFYSKRLLAFSLLLLCLVVSALTISGCKKKEENETPVTVDPITVFANGSSGYTIVRADKASNEVVMASADLRIAFSERVGIDMPLRDEYEYGRGEQTPTIVVGKTSDEVSVRLSSEIRYDDYLIHVENGNLYLIGGSDGATVNAVNYFIKTYLLQGTDSLSLEGNLDMRYTKEYAIRDLSIAGEPISSYRIVYDNDLFYSKQRANDLNALLIEKCGVNLEVVPDTADEYQFEILVGETNRLQSAAIVDSFDAPNVYYRATVVDNKLVLVNQGVRTGEVILEQIEKYFDTLTADACNITASSLNISGDIKSSTDKKAMERAEGTDLRILQNNVLRAVYKGEYETEFTEQQRAELLADTYLMYLPDVIILNEMINGCELPGVLRNLLSDYYEFADATYLELFDDPASGSGQHYENLKNRKYATPIAFRKNSGLKEIESGFSYLSNMISYHGVSWTVFETSEGNRFLAVSAHLSNNRNEDNEWITTYAEDALRIVNIARNKYGDLPVVMGGDFFFWQNDKCLPYNYMIDAGYTDASESAQIKHSIGIGTFHDLGVGSQDRSEEDLIFINSEWFTALSHKVLISYGTVNASDHYPVLVDLCFNKASTEDDIPGFDDGTGDLIVKDEGTGGSGVWGKVDIAD